MFIADQETLSIQGSSNESHLGKTLTELGIELPANSVKNYVFFDKIQDTSNYFIIREYQDYYIGIMRNTSSIFSAIPLPMLVVFLSLVVASAIIIFGISFYSRKEQKQQLALQTALKKAEIASRSKSSFLFNMSHDIRTPMNAILGLSITKNLLEQMDGSISCISEPGKGSTFTFRVPFKVGTVDDLPNEIDIVESTREHRDFSGKRLLLVEDIELNREIIIELLADYGLLIEEAEDGFIAVDKITKASPGYYHLILMDIQMPNMNGYQASEAIRKLQDPEKSNIPIIAVTANAFEDDRKNAFASGMNDHLAKPVDFEKLIEILEKYLLQNN